MQRLASPSTLFLAALLASACSSSNATPDPANPNNDSTSKPGDAGTGKGNPTGPTGDAGTSVPSGGTSGPANGSGTPSGPELFLWRDKIYGGFDGTHAFIIPTSIVLLNDDGTNLNVVPFATPPTFALADPSIASIKLVAAPNSPDLAKDPILKASTFAVITPTKAGQTTLSVSYQGQTVKAGLSINAYTPDQYTLGQTRYTAPANPGAKRVACVTCHAVDSDAGVNAPRHDPFLQQDLSDAELLTIIKQGLYEANNPNSALDAPGGHQWDLTPDEEKAIPVYLRSLKPLGF